MLPRYFKRFFFKTILCILGLASGLILPALSYAQTDSYWEEMQLYGGQITAISVDLQDNSILYAGSWTGDGLFKSTDSGITWTAIPEFRTRIIFDISIDPNNPSNIWVANNQLVAFSHDYGATWDDPSALGA